MCYDITHALGPYIYMYIMAYIISAKDIMYASGGPLMGKSIAKVYNATVYIPKHIDYMVYTVTPIVSHDCNT